MAIDEKAVVRQKNAKNVFMMSNLGGTSTNIDDDSRTLLN